jgi:hypothetical protein
MVVGGSYGLKIKATSLQVDSPHGTHSAILDYNLGIRYIRIDFVDSLALDEFADFCMEIKPLTECGFVYIELWFDGDGDGKWTSSSERDLKLFTSRSNISSLGLEVSEWTNLYLLDLEYGESRARGSKSRLLEWIEENENLNLVRLYIRFETSPKNYSSDGSIWLFDYFRLNDLIASFEPNEGPYEKVGKPKKISQNGKITYTITYGNDFNNTTLTNLVIVEDYDPRMSLLSADPPPDPGTNNVWTIGNVSPGQYGRIVLVMKMYKQNFVADVDGRVSGTGFVSVRRRFSTDRDPHLIINNVRISCDQFERSGRVETPVRPVVGTTLSFSEHGSGRYESEEVLSYRTSRMKMNREFDAVWAPSVLNLSFGRAVGYNSSWYASHLCMDEKRGSIIRERYLYADRLNCTGAAEVRSTRLILDSESNFSGMAIYEIESHTDRDALITSVFEGSYSLRSGTEVYK